MVLKPRMFPLQDLPDGKVKRIVQLFESGLKRKNRLLKYDVTKTPEKDTFSTLKRHSLQELKPKAELSTYANSKHASDTMHHCDNSLNEIYQIEVFKDSKSNLSVRMSLDSGCNISDYANTTLTLPKNENKYCKPDSHGTSLYKLVKSMGEVNSPPTEMRSTDFHRLNHSGSPKCSSPVEMRLTNERSFNFYQQELSKSNEEMVTAQWILDRLRLSCPDLNISHDPNEVCTISKVQDVFEDLKKLISSKKDSEKNMVSLFRENRSAMQMIKKQARELEDKYNHLQCSNRITETLYNEIEEINSDRNQLLLANKTLHNELSNSYKKIAYLEQDICSHICQKSKPQNSRDCSNPHHLFDILELRTEVKEQHEKILQQNQTVDWLGTLINATWKVLHQQEHKIQNIPGICNLLKMINGEVDPSTVLEAAATLPQS